MNYDIIGHFARFNDRHDYLWYVANKGLINIAKSIFESNIDNPYAITVNDDGLTKLLERKIPGYTVFGQRDYIRKFTPIYHQKTIVADYFNGNITYFRLYPKQRKRKVFMRFSPDKLPVKAKNRSIDDVYNLIPYYGLYNRNGRRCGVKITYNRIPSTFITKELLALAAMIDV